MATAKKTSSAKSVVKSSTAASKGAGAVTITIDLGGLEAMYRKQYVIRVDGGGGDTKGGDIKLPAKDRPRPADAVAKKVVAKPGK